MGSLENILCSTATNNVPPHFQLKNVQSNSLSTWGNYLFGWLLASDRKIYCKHMASLMTCSSFILRQIAPQYFSVLPKLEWNQHHMVPIVLAAMLSIINTISHAIQLHQQPKIWAGTVEGLKFPANNCDAQQGNGMWMWYFRVESYELLVSTVV